MKIAIASDIHDNLPNLRKFLDFIRKEGSKYLVLCGDTGTDEETFKLIANNFKGKAFLVSGNMDEDISTMQKFENQNTKIKTFETVGEITINGLEIAFCHFPVKARELAGTKKHDFVFYGHTHKPWLEQIESCILANPGNLSGILYKATFALLDSKTKNLSLKILERI